MLVRSSSGGGNLQNSELIWTNTGSTSSMSAKTLNGSTEGFDLSPFTFICVITNSENTIIIPIDSRAQAIGFTYSGTSLIAVRRSFWPIKSTNSIQIYDADRITQGSGKTTDNAQEIPMKIYGIY